MILFEQEDSDTLKFNKLEDKFKKNEIIMMFTVICGKV